MSPQRSAAATYSSRLVALAIAVVLAAATVLVAAQPADASGPRVISGTFTVPSSGIESWWPDTVLITAQSTDGDSYAQATVDPVAKTFTFADLAAGHYVLTFGASLVAHFDPHYYESANLVGGVYNGGTAVDVTSGNATGITYAFAAGRTVSGTVSLGSGASAAWKSQLQASVSVPGPDGCECGDTLSTKVNASNGTYVIRGLPKKSLTVYFGPEPGSTANLIPEYYNNSYTYAGAAALDFAAGNKTGINATLEVGKTISGTVTLPEGVAADALGAINVEATGDGGQQRTAEVDATTGNYSFYGLVPDMYTLKFNAGDWYAVGTPTAVHTPLANVFYGGAYTPSGATKVNVTTANATGRNQLMVVGRTISGTVTLGSGVDALWINHLNAYAESDESFRSATVDPATGAYTITGLAPASYTVQFQSSGYSSGGDWVASPMAFEYYDNSRSPYTATPVNVATANQTGINAAMDLQVGDRLFWLTPTPIVTGTATPGHTLTAAAGTWEPHANSLAYQWLRDESEISGATASTFAVTQADAAHTLSVRVTGSTDGFAPVAQTSAGRAVPPTAFAAAPIPTITGTAAVAQTLTANPGTWSPAATLAYQWKRNGTAIDDATDPTYVVTQADAATNLTVSVKGTLGGYVTTTKTSAAVPVPASPFVSAPGVGILGSAVVGNTLTANVGDWNPTPAFTFSWLRNGVPIPGATGATYDLVEADGGQYIVVTVTGTLAGYLTITRQSGAVRPPGLIFTSTPAPVITGTFAVGKTLTTVAPAWTPGADSFALRWLRDGEPIDGAFGASYTLTAADYGHGLAVRAEGHRDGYERQQSQSASTTVRAGTFSTIPTPTITGSTGKGATLTAKPGTWVPAPSAITYQWYRGGAAISGATKSTYRLTGSDSGKKITVKVTGKRAAYTTASKTSAAKALPKYFTKAPAPKVNGTVKVGSTVKVSVGTWSPKPSSYSYQWYRNGVAISKATKSSYKLAAADKGKKLTVKVTAKRSGYASTPATSAAKTVAAGTFTKAPAPKITGTAKVGSTLKIARGTWSPKPSSYAYQWYRSGKAISGATRSSYKLTSSDKGKTITVKVTAKKTAYTSKAKTSAKTAKVK